MEDFFYISPNRWRSFGIPQQFKVYNRKDILDNIQKYNTYKDCYLSISEHEQIGLVTLTIPLFLAMDFDASNSYTITDAYIDALKVRRWLIDNDISYMFNFSGAKGWHIIVPLHRVIIANNSQFKAFYNFIKNKLDLPTLDPKVFEVQRIIRIPTTINMKSGKECCTIEIREGRKLNLFEYSDNENSFSNTGIESSNKNEDVFYFPHSEYSPCIEELICKEEVPHDIRWMWVKLMRNYGHSPNEILESAKEMPWSDFNESKTRYYIKYNMTHFATISCGYIISLGLCLGDKCPFKFKK